MCPAMTVEELERNFFLVEDATGSCTARFASDLPDSLADATEMPAAVVACDLACQSMCASAGADSTTWKGSYEMR